MCLQNQNRLNRITGQRATPPHVCPECLLGEYIREQVNTGKLHWLAPIFKWESAEEEEVITAQGLLGFPKLDKLSDAQKLELREHGVNLKFAWKEDGRAKLNWIFTIIEHNHPEEGIFVAIEAGLLGDKVRKVIKQTMEAKGMVPGGSEKNGNPLVRPYPFKWTYNDAEGIAFGDKYDATAFPEVTPTPEVEALLLAEPPREAVANIMRQPDLVALRKNLEEHCLLKNVPWDTIFAPAYQLYKDNMWETSHRVEAEEEAAKGPVASVTNIINVQSPALPSPNSDEIVACDKCNADMFLSETVCKSCGHDYSPPPVATKPKRSRSGSKPAQSAVVAMPPPSIPIVSVQVDDLFAKPPSEEEEDELPF